MHRLSLLLSRCLWPLAAAVFAVVLLSAVPPVFAAGKNVPFSFETVVSMARELSKKPYTPPKPVDKALLDMSYDDLRDIRFRTDESLWRKEKLPAEVQFFHPGYIFKETILLNEVVDGKARPLPLSRDLFDYGWNKDIKERMPKTVGAAGFRFHGAINNSDYLDEYLVFLGASYFRAVAKGQHYGLSARGLAVDTAMPKPEEFPVFREFWLHRPAPGDTFVDVTALLDSKSLTGAYTFRTWPGEETVTKVTAQLFFRAKVDKLGVAPLTSMFLYGENTMPGGQQDWRPEVHDSDGLLIHTGYGEWVWRPLQNPYQLMVNQFQDNNIKGFGLLQRDRDYKSYLDLEADMERRPSLWIEPGENWGKGHVELFHIPSVEEINDNIVAYWVPENSPVPGETMAFSYTMSWHNAPAGRPVGGAYVTSTRNSRLDDKTQIMIIEYEGGELVKKTAEDKIDAEVWVGDGGTLKEVQSYRNDMTGGWRVSFKVELAHPTRKKCTPPKPGSPVEMRAYLKQGKDVLSETWSYAIEP